MINSLLLDYDETLAPFKQYAGTQTVKGMLALDFGSKSEEIGDEFGQIHDSMLSLLHSKADSKAVETMRNINSYTVLTSYNIGEYDIGFMWSRELWMKYLSDKYELELEGDAIMRITDAYWDAIAQASPLYPEVADYISMNRDLGVFVITSSDRRLSINHDIVRYDPAYSEKKKLARLGKSGLLKLLKAENIITGDPFDKPSTQFWDRAIARAGIADPKEAIVVDDSLTVIKSAKERGFTGYIIDRSNIYDKNNIAGSIDKYITNLDQLVVERKRESGLV